MRLILASSSPRRRELLTAAGYEFDVTRPHEEAEAGLCSNCGPAEWVANLAFSKAADVVRQLRGVGTGQGAEQERAIAEAAEIAATDPVAGRASDPTQVLKSDDPNSRSFVVLAADTVAECEGHILGKPRDEDHARQMLEMLSGREHRVYTGVCVWPAAKCQSEQAATGHVGVAHGTEPGTRVTGNPSTRVAVTTLRMDDLTASQLDEYLESGGWKGKAGAFGYQDRLGWVHITEGSESNVVGLPMELLSEMLQDAGYR